MTAAMVDTTTGDGRCRQNRDEKYYESNDPAFHNGPLIPSVSNKLHLHPLRNISNKKPANPGNGGRFSF
jgi:hypothetical protein